MPPQTQLSHQGCSCIAYNMTSSACTHYSSSHFAKATLAQSNLEHLLPVSMLSGHFLYKPPNAILPNSGQIAKASRHMQSTKEMFLYNATPSRLGQVAVPPNSWKQTQKVKIRRKRNMLQTE